MSENKKAPEFCLLCHDMYGHAHFDGMCSVCFKQQRAEAKRQEQRQELKVQESLKNLAACKTEVEKVQNSENQQQYNKVEPQTPNSRIKVEPQPQIKREVNKCASCNKKVGMLGYKCKHCINEFCKMHRLPEDHECGVDFISLGRKQLKLENPTLSKRKLEEV